MPSRFTSQFTALLLLGLVALHVPAAPAAAQSDSDIRRQNQQLTAQVRDLEQELQASRDQIEKLKARIAQLERQLAQRGGSAGDTPIADPEPEKVSIDESVPHASPRALYAAVLASHDQALGGIDLGRDGDGKRRAYLKRLEAWAASANRQFRGQIVWHVRLVDARTEDVIGDRTPEHIATLIAVDPVTNVQLGDQFDVVLPKALAARLERLAQRDALGVMVLRGTIIPAIRVNPDRTERGSFDNPPFIGPFAEYLWSIDVRSLKSVEEDTREQAAAPAERPDESKPAEPVTPEK